jgi:hypothetical protein
MTNYNFGKNKTKGELIKDFEGYLRKFKYAFIKCSSCKHLIETLIFEHFFYKRDKNIYLIFASFRCSNCNMPNIITYEIQSKGSGTLTYPIQSSPKKIEKYNSIFPESIDVDPPNEDLNENIKEDYIEASKIYKKSPRGACALLRLALQKMLKQLGQKGQNINDDIKNLVSNGLDSDIQKGLDIVRVIGNNAVHPGHINIKDDIDTAKKIFDLINFIAENQISQKKKLKKLFDEKIPESQKKAIIKRDLIKKKE